MRQEPRLVAVVFEVSDLPRSVELYRRAFGLDLQPRNHGGSDRWTSGPHASHSWTGGSFLHFALYQAKSSEGTRGGQIGFSVVDIEAAHEAAMAAGAEVIHGPRAEEWGQSARYRDYDGNVIELTQRS